MKGMTPGTRVLLAMALLTALPAQAQVVEYIHTDALGTPIAVTDASGAVIERFEYEPYGLQVAGPVEDGPGYTGHVEDTLTGMTYMQQRYYDPVVERFLSVDPVTAYSGAGANFNRYWYAGNNPYRFTDPDGRQVSAPKSCRLDGSCIPLDQVNRGDATMMKVVAAPVVVGGTAGLATATGATAATAATVRTVTPKVVEAAAKATNAVNSATTSVAVRAQIAVESEATMALSSTGMNAATVASIASRIADPQSIQEVASGVVAGFAGVDEPSTSVANLIGERLGQRLRVDYENAKTILGGDE